MKTISLKVSNSAAERFRRMTNKEKLNLNKLFNEIIEDKRTLFEVMDDMSAYAAKKGLTPEKLDEILNKE